MSFGACHCATGLDALSIGAIFISGALQRSAWIGDAVAEFAYLTRGASEAVAVAGDALTFGADQACAARDKVTGTNTLACPAMLA